MGRTFHVLRSLAAALAFIVVILTPAAANAQQERRVALVIGNGAYQHLPRLANPVNDAELMATTLKLVGFQLIGGKAQTDLDRSGFERAIRQFGAELKDGAVGLFYYAGHGLQVQGANFLVPVAADPMTVADVDFELIDANVVLKQMESAGSKLNIVILDACRNNPFGGRGLRDASSGLAPMRAPRGTLISYATQPGNTAMDGTADHSPFTAALAYAVQQPGRQVFEVFNDVALSVYKETSGRQQPWIASSPFEGVFYFTSPVTINVAPAPGAAPSGGPTADTEIVFWLSIAGSNQWRRLRGISETVPTGPICQPGEKQVVLAAVRIGRPGGGTGTDHTAAEICAGRRRQLRSGVPVQIRKRRSGG
jgi:caspase domain-containing protein